MQLTAILAVLSTISTVMDNKLVKRMLENVCKKTTNTVDDWVIAALYGVAQAVEAKSTTGTTKTDDATAETALAEVQDKYDALTETEKTAAKTTASASLVMPWME